MGTDADQRHVQPSDKTGICLPFEDGGAEGIRTPDPHNAIVVLYQLS